MLQINDKAEVIRLRLANSIRALGSIGSMGEDILDLLLGVLRRTITSLRENLGLWALAFVFSISLWALVTNEENPPRIDTFPSDIAVEPVNVPGGLDIRGSIEPVRLRVAAPADLWRSLSAANFKATVDLSTAASGVQETRVHAESTDGRVKVLEVIPPKIRVQLETLKKQLVPVRVNLQNSVPFGYNFDPPKVSIEQVTVLGPESLVDQVDAAVADVNLDGVKVSINQSFRLTPRASRGYEIRGVTLEPDTVAIQVPIKQELVYQSYPVVPRVKGTVAEGYGIKSVAVEPLAVTVVGTREALQGVNFVQTVEVDVTGVAADLTRKVALELPPGVSLVGTPDVNMRVTIVPAQGTRSFRVAVQTKGLASGLKANILTEVVEVTVAGDVPTLQTLSPLEITPTIDVSKLGPGLHFVTVETPKIRAGQIVKVEPQQVGVIIS